MGKDYVVLSLQGLGHAFTVSAFGSLPEVREVKTRSKILLLENNVGELLLLPA